MFDEVINPVQSVEPTLAPTKLERLAVEENPALAWLAQALIGLTDAEKKDKLALQRQISKLGKRALAAKDSLPVTREELQNLDLGKSDQFTAAVFEAIDLFFAGDTVKMMMVNQSAGSFHSSREKKIYHVYDRRKRLGVGLERMEIATLKPLHLALAVLKYMTQQDIIDENDALAVNESITSQDWSFKPDFEVVIPLTANLNLVFSYSVRTLFNRGQATADHEAYNVFLELNDHDEQIADKVDQQLQKNRVGHTVFKLSSDAVKRLIAEQDPYALTQIITLSADEKDIKSLAEAGLVAKALGLEITAGELRVTKLVCLEPRLGYQVIFKVAATNKLIIDVDQSKMFTVRQREKQAEKDQIRQTKLKAAKKYIEDVLHSASPIHPLVLKNLETSFVEEVVKKFSHPSFDSLLIKETVFEVMADVRDEYKLYRDKPVREGIRTVTLESGQAVNQKLIQGDDYSFAVESDANHDGTIFDSYVEVWPIKKASLKAKVDRSHDWYNL